MSSPATPIAGLLALAVLVGASNASAQALSLDPTDEAWVLNGDAEAATLDGGAVLLLRSGSAIRPDIAFRDGTISFEMRPTDRRAFLGVVFRAQEDGTGEDVYLRLHKSGLADALQYTPDYGGRGQWQIYHGPDATAPARFEAGEWQRVRVEVSGSQAALFVGETERPQLIASRLRAGVDSGSIAFWGNQPGATGDDPPSAALRNIVIEPGTTTWQFDAPSEEEPLPGIITAWSVAGPYARSGDDVLALPIASPATERTVAPNGVLELDRHVGRIPDGVSFATAGVRIRSPEPRTVRLRLGFSDDASVFLNGRLIGSFRNAFSTNFPRRQGLLLDEQASVYLPLREGNNDLVVAVSEIFGGWGLAGRIADREGLVVEPLP